MNYGDMRDACHRPAAAVRRYGAVLCRLTPSRLTVLLNRIVQLHRVHICHNTIQIVIYIYIYI